MKKLESRLLERNLAAIERGLVAVLPYFPGGIEENYRRWNLPCCCTLLPPRHLVVGILLDEVEQKIPIFMVSYENIT